MKKKTNVPMPTEPVRDLADFDPDRDLAPLVDWLETAPVEGEMESPEGEPMESPEGDVMSMLTGDAKADKQTVLDNLEAFTAYIMDTLGPPPWKDMDKENQKSMKYVWNQMTRDEKTACKAKAKAKAAQ